MSQQAKDFYAGIKKIFPSSRRSGSFSFTSRRSTPTLEIPHKITAPPTDDVVPEQHSAQVTDTNCHSSFSFSTWKDKERGGPSDPSSPSVIMSLPYGAPAATPKGRTAVNVSEDGDKGPRPSLTKTITNALHSTSTCAALFGSNGDNKTPTSTLKARPSSFSSTSFGLASPLPKLGTRSRSIGGKSSTSVDTCMVETLSEEDGQMTRKLEGHGQVQEQENCKKNSGQKSVMCPRKNTLMSFRAVKNAPKTYQSSSSAFSNLTGSTASSSSTSTIVESPKKTRGKKSRRMSLSFSSATRKEKTRELEEIQEHECTKRTSYLMNEEAAEMRPHASTWDSDSDDEYENTKRPTPGLDRRSQSMDFMEQAPTHLISKIWRKLPIQARLIGGRGNIDLDLQKDRVSFSRSSEARKFALAAEKAKAAELYRRSLTESKDHSPVSQEDVLGPGVTKRTRFSSKLKIIASDANDGAAGAYTALESYDDVLVRVCKFAAHDQRPTSTKVQEFLERSMAFLHGTRTKHGNVVNISNGEIRMWRRMALHDWTLEDVTTTQAAAALGVKGKDVEPPLLRRSIATDGSDSNSDSQQWSACQRLHSASPYRSLSESVVEEEPEIEGDEGEELDVPSNMKFAKLCDVVNCCVNFGDMLFTPDEINDLVRLEFIVEEDGWI